ncbi:hypothetical protein HZI65_05045 [Haemophilus haemolyticus]|jgi:hypothetical protein|uniref:Uncharacterized protein n=1 Tax=Haemophilus haemolyticus TaxID=726 RepID=A0A502JQQ6_HAEHA|nr:hypothetical protein [Haemophilus haemolyticus]NYA25403.1 hypothetical protein [Haemophilus haemolyticus]TPG99698.1 hypothetical protein EUX55_05095 [Haemophilus haemolyticus]
MKKIVKIFIVFFGLNATSSLAYDDWIKADKTGAQSIDFTYVRCFYKTSMFGSFTNQPFSFIIQGSTFDCPYSVEYNPVTGEWRE